MSEARESKTDERKSEDSSVRCSRIIMLGATWLLIHTLGK